MPAYILANSVTNDLVNAIQVKSTQLRSIQSNSIHPLVHWSIGPLVHWSIGPLFHWSIGPLVHLSIGPLVRWSIGPLDYWSIGPLVECQILNVHKVKLLLKRTSGVPPVIFYMLESSPELMSLSPSPATSPSTFSILPELHFS